MRGVVLLLGLCACAEAGRETHAAVDAAAGKQDGSVKLVDARSADAAPSNVCASTATCATATALNNMSGDSNFDMQTASGYQSAWYKVRVTEDDSGPFGVQMVLNATLTSPASSNYDLYIYLNKGSDQIECTTPTGNATRNGTSDALRETWGEGGTFSNGNDDSRTVSIEIRPTGTSCDAAMPWQLSLIGDD